MIRSKEEAMAVRVFRNMAGQAATEELISSRVITNSIQISRCLHDGEPIPEHLLPGRMVELMKKRLSHDEKDSLKFLTSDLIQDRLI